MNKVVFADPNNKAARELEADAFEQLGYWLSQDHGVTPTSPVRRSCVTA